MPPPPPPFVFNPPPIGEPDFGPIFGPGELPRWGAEKPQPIDNDDFNGSPLLQEEDVAYLPALCYLLHNEGQLKELTPRGASTNFSERRA